MWEIIQGQGKHQVKLQMLETSNGWCGLLCGGEQPHVGGVVMAVPRPSLSGQGQSCDLWITPAPGHKDTEAAAPLAKQICQYFNTVVSLSAGIHIDQATAQDIEIIQHNCHIACRDFLLQYQKDQRVE